MQLSIPTGLQRPERTSPDPSSNLRRPVVLNSDRDRASLISSLPENSISRLVEKARRLLGSPDLAEDAVQEALVALWRTETWPRSPDAWLEGAVHLRSLHMHRTLRRRSFREARAGRERQTEERGGFDAKNCPICTAEGHSRLLAAINRLRPEHRSLLSGFYFDGLDYKDLAAEQGVSKGTIASRLNRAREALRQSLPEDTLEND